MGVLWAKVLIDGRSGRAVPEGTDYTRVIRVRCESKADDETTIGVSGYVPLPLSQHPFNFLATLRSIDISQHKGLLWDVKLDYSTRPLSHEEREKLLHESPLDREADVVLSWQPHERLTVKDRDGNAILNSAGAPFRDAVAVPASRLVVKVTKNLASRPAFFLTHQNKLNASAYSIGGLTFSAETLLFVPGEVGGVQIENEYEYFRATWQLEFRDDWAVSLLDAGFVFLDSNGEQRQILIQGEVPADPVLLDGAGGVLANPTPETAEYRDFDVIETADFSAIPTL